MQRKTAVLHALVANWAHKKNSQRGPMQNLTEANKYTIYGAIFGICFPIGSIFFLYVVNELGSTTNIIEMVRLAHENSLLYVIDTAPFFLGLFARFAGIRQDRIRGFLASLEQQVERKTESLRMALNEAHKANEMIAHMADHDPLTGLLNRRCFQKALEHWIEYAIRYKRKGTLLFIDLDNFKEVNDQYGHNAGDQYLVAVATLLTKTLRSTDFVARWGGDEFAAFIPETAGLEAHTVGNKLLAAFAKTPFHFGKVPFQLSASIGLAFVPEHTSDANELIMSADAAMFEAKKAGRGCWRLYAASDTEIQRVQEHLQWESRIRRALENDQFFLLYQPLLNLTTGMTEGYEALLRMEDRDGQLITPDHFLESANRSNLSSPIDFMVIRKAVRRIAARPGPDLDVWVSVNISAKTLKDTSLINQIDMALKEYPVHTGTLRFEISEAIALQNLTTMREVSAKIKDLGCLLILDDFGLGPASVHYLEQLSISMVKIHPGVTRGLANDVKKQNYLKSLAKMLQGFQLTVAAKSVEDHQLLNILREVGFDYAQGFAIGRPLESIETDADEAK